MTCAFSRFDFTSLSVAPPALASSERVRGAGVLMLVYRYGIGLRFFEAIERARTLLGTDRLRLDHRSHAGLIDRLYCYPPLRHRAGPDDLVALAASVLGITDPDVPEERRDTRIQGMLADLLDALNDACDGRCRASGPSAAELQRLRAIGFAVQARLTGSMSVLAATQVRDLQSRFTEVSATLTELAPHLVVRARPGAGSGRPDLWDAVSALVGDDLRADGVDLVGAVQTIEAWRTVFDALDGALGGRPPAEALCGAAAQLRPPGRRRTCSCSSSPPRP